MRVLAAVVPPRPRRLSIKWRRIGNFPVPNASRIFASPDRFGDDPGIAAVALAMGDVHCRNNAYSAVVDVGTMIRVSASAAMGFIPDRAVGRLIPVGRHLINLIP